VSCGTERFDSRLIPPCVRILNITVSQLRLNPLTGRWVTIVAERAKRPSDFAPRDPEIDGDPARPCPFCPGHEDPKLPPLDTVEDDAGGWRMRVIPNLYPAFDGTAGFVVHHLGPVHVTAEASGIHEVFVYTPNHGGGLDELDDKGAAELMRVLQRRLAAHAAAPEVRYTQVIINHGREAGASLVHPHAQILGLPFVPGEILDEERAFARFAGGCVICTTIEAELAAAERVVFADDDVVCVAPFWSGAPFELLLMPRHHEAHLQDADQGAIESMGRGIRDAVRHLNGALGDVAYNLGFHTAPHEHGGLYHWHVHLWPNLVTAAGFERGTGVMINVMPPETAAETLRAVRTPA
jgi:UDPglucose--hexose-1-phosphate uridylyltransferase